MMNLKNKNMTIDFIIQHRKKFYIWAKNLLMNSWELFNHKMSMNGFIVLIIIMSLTIFGCAAPKVKMYPGEKVADSKQAVIKGEIRAKKREVITITKVDGEMTIDYSTHLAGDWWGAVEVYVLPGKHKMVTRTDSDSSYAYGCLWVVAEPGETYIVKARTEGYRSVMWLENERSGKKIGGVTDCN